MTRADGSGLFCLPGAGKLAGRIGEMCKGWQPSKLTDTNLRRSKITCGYRRKRLVRRTTSRRGRAKSYRSRSRSRSNFARNFFRQAYGG